MPEGMAWHSLSNPWIQMFLDQRCEPLPRPQWTHRHIADVRRRAATQARTWWNCMMHLRNSAPPMSKNAKCGQGMGGSYATVIWFTKAERQCVTRQHHAQKPSPAHFSAGGFGRLSGALQLSSTPSSLEACRECVRAPAARHQSRDGTRGQHHSRYVFCYARLLINSYSIKT